MSAPIVQQLQGAVHERIPADERALIAVSGGIDSMVLLHAAAAVRPANGLVVATFDHASGPHAARAVDLVERVAMSAGMPVVIGRGEQVERPSEAAWRDARLAFLRAVAAEHRAVICMAHTNDDQVETVLFRELRGAGTRGLAGLAVAGTIRRPLLAFRRADIADYAGAAGVEWVDDPTNLDRSFSRNRLRHDLIPALRAVSPRIESDLVEIGRRAAAWRADVEQVVDSQIAFQLDRRAAVLDVSGESLAGLSDDVLAIVWPELLGRLGIAADWRGTRRLVAFTTKGRSGQRIQLSGGWSVYRRRRGFEICRSDQSGERWNPGQGLARGRGD